MIDVTVYYTKSCPYCVRVKDFLTRNNIKYIGVDLEENKFAINTLKEKIGELSVPITKIGDEYVKGYNVLKLRELLNIE